MIEEVVRLLSEIETRLERLESSEFPSCTTQKAANVSDPPTDAELDALFGVAANLPQGVLYEVRDIVGAPKHWLCQPSNGSWYYVELILAV